MTEMKVKQDTNDYFSFIFILLPLIFTIVGILYFPTSFVEQNRFFLGIPMFGGLILLFIGSIIIKGKFSHILKILGWLIFAFYWSTQIIFLFEIELNDYINAGICVIGVFVLSYFAYHEYLCIKRKEKVDCLNWVAAASAIAGFIYFGIELSPIQQWLIEVVANHSAMVLNLIFGNVEANGVDIFWDGRYVITIIFACTAIQSIVIFVGMLVPLPKVQPIRKFYGLLVTLVPIYILNLFRNGIIAYLVKDDSSMFEIAHNWIGKGGSLLALIILLLIVIKIVPEVFDEITSLTELPKRNGPIEKFITKYVWRTK